MNGFQEKQLPGGWPFAGTPPPPKRTGAEQDRFHPSLIFGPAALPLQGHRMAGGSKKTHKKRWSARQKDGINFFCKGRKAAQRPGSEGKAAGRECRSWQKALAKGLTSPCSLRLPPIQSLTNAGPGLASTKPVLSSAAGFHATTAANQPGRWQGRSRGGVGG